MLDVLKALWHPADSLSRMQDVLGLVMDLLEHFEVDKLKDGESTRNAAIDAVIQLLQSEKK